MGSTRTRARRVSWRKLALVGAAFAVVAGACGGDDDDSADSTIASSAVVETTEGADTTTAPTSPDTTTAPSGPDTTTAPTGPDTTAAPTTSAPEEGQPGGEITYMHNAFIQSFDPALVASQGLAAGHYIQAVFGALVDLDFDTRTVVTPNFAKSLETDDDGLTWTLVLNEGITFTDGEPYDAEAVKFNWDRYLAEAPTKSLGATKIASVEVVDPLTLSITLTEPFPQWPTVLGPMVVIGSPKAITEMGDAFSTAPVGAGPYMVTEFISGQSVTMERNPNYWKEGLPYLDKLTLISQPDGARRVDALLAGEVDVAAGKPDQVDRLEAAGLVKFASSSALPVGGAGWIFNVTKPPFDDKELRCAMAQTIDREALNRDLAAGNTIYVHEDGTVYDSFIHSGPAKEGAHTFPPYDHDAAQEVINAYAERTGGPVTFTLNTLDQFGLETQYLVTQWATFDNLEVTVESKPTPDTFGVVSTGGHQMAFIGWSSEYSAAFTINQYGHSRPDGTGNPWTGYTSPEFDDAIERAISATDEDARDDAVREAQDIIVDECLYNFVPLAALGAPYGKDTINGWENTVLGTVWEKVWLDQ